VQISEDLEVPCDEFRDRLNQLEREVEAVGGAYVGTQVNEKLDLQTNVLHDMQANRQGYSNVHPKFSEQNKDDINLANEDIENFLPD
jgi:hypothetical protein